MLRELPTVRQIMNPRPPLLHRDTPLLAAVDVLLRRDNSAAPVVDEGGLLVGILSEKNCLELLTEGDSERHDEPTGVVGNVMTTEVATLPADMDVYYAAGRFLKDPYKYYPVVEDGRVVGEVSRRTLLRCVRGMLRVAHVEASGH